jgi:hypothetical protein
MATFEMADLLKVFLENELNLGVDQSFGGTIKISPTLFQ